MTDLIGPYDDIPTTGKVRVQCLVPPEVRKHLFHHVFYRRGACDKLLARFVEKLYLLTKDNPDFADPLQNEEIINNIINQLTLCPEK